MNNAIVSKLQKALEAKMQDLNAAEDGAKEAHSLH